MWMDHYKSSSILILFNYLLKNKQKKQKGTNRKSELQPTTAIW